MKTRLAQLLFDVGVVFIRWASRLVPGCGGWTAGLTLDVNANRADGVPLRFGQGEVFRPGRGTLIS